MSLLMLPPVTIDDTTLVSSSVPSDVWAVNVQATGTLTTPAAGGVVAATGHFTISITPHVHATAHLVIYRIAVGEHFSIAGHQFTGVASRSTTYEVTATTVHEDAAANIRTAINADISDHCTAVRNSYTLDLTATSADPTVGNAIAIDQETATGVIVTDEFGGGSNPVPYIGDHIHVSTQQFDLVATRAGAGQVTFAESGYGLTTNITDAINADIADVDATGAVPLVNLVAHTAGAAGNAITYVGCTGIVAAHAHLENGSDTAIVLDQTFVVGSQTFIIKASGTTTGYVIRSTVSATAQGDNIVTAINRDLSGVVQAVNAAGVVTITADPIATPGTDGNSIVLTNAVSGITVSAGGTLTGGVDASSGYRPWASTTTYGDGDVVVVDADHHYYESLRATNTNNLPIDNLIGANPYWLDLGAVNRWKMFDGAVDTQTSNAESIVVALTPGSIDAVALFNCNASSINITLVDGVTEVYNEDITPTTTASGVYFKTDLPTNNGAYYPDAVLTVTITNTGSIATCGLLAVGLGNIIGTILADPGPSIRIIDYSIKLIDQWGVAYITERSYSRRVTYPISIDIASHVKVKNTLAQYRAIPTVWLGSDIYSLLNVYGFPKDWSMDIGLNTVDMSLEIEGWI